MKKTKLLLERLNYILNKYQKVLCVLVFILTCIGSILECIGVSAIIPVVNVVLAPQKMKESAIVKNTPSLNGLSVNELVMAVILAVILVYLFKNIFFVFLSWIRVKFSSKIQREVTVRMMRSYMGRGYQFFLQRNYGELYRGVAEDPMAVYGTLHTGLRMISDIITVVLLCIFLMMTDWIMSLAMVAVSFLCVLIIYVMFRKKLEFLGEEKRKYGARSTQAISQAFQGIKDVLITRKQNYFVNEYEKNQVSLQKARCKCTVAQESPTYIIECICITGLMLVIAARVLMGDTQSEVFLANMAAFAIAAFRILPSLGRISISMNEIMTNLPSVEAVWENLKEAEKYAEEHPEVQFDYYVSNGLIDKGIREKKEKHKVDDYYLKECVDLDNVSFRYSANTEYILKHVNLKIHKGQAIALIGTSGAGKSTMVDILLGLLVPEEGSVCIDGKNITTMSDEWAQVIGYVPQSVFLSDDSIMNNIAFGETSSEIDVARVEEALERAELKDYVDALPNGLNTFVGDRGIRLSGGQRQRIAIARALYHRPQILVLDEATSALDNDTETAIMSAIDSLQGTVTLVIVAHRLSTVRNCDIIYEVGNQGIRVRSKEEIFSK